MKYILVSLFFALISGCAEPPIRADLHRSKYPVPPIVISRDLQFRTGEKFDLTLLAGTYYHYMENAAGKFYIGDAPCVMNTFHKRDFLTPAYFAWTGGIWISTNPHERPQLWYISPSVRGDTWEEFSARRAEVAASLTKRSHNNDATDAVMSIALPRTVANPTAGSVAGGAAAAGLVGAFIDMSKPLPLGVADNQKFDEDIRQIFRAP